MCKCNKPSNNISERLIRRKPVSEQSERERAATLSDTLVADESEGAKRLRSQSLLVYRQCTIFLLSILNRSSDKVYLSF